jgi:tetratricopeptide (TPR) repeat protein
MQNKQGPAEYFSCLLVALQFCSFNPAMASAATGDKDKEAKALVISGYQEMQKGRFEQSAKILSRALALQPNNVQTRRYLAHALLNSGQAKEALGQFELLVKIKPVDPSDYFNMGEANRQLGHYLLAIQGYDAAINSDPRQFDSAKARIILCYQSLGNEAKAIKVCEDALKNSRNPASKKYFEDTLAKLKTPTNDPETSKNDGDNKNSEKVPIDGKPEEQLDPG